MDHLGALESQSIYILREAYNRFDRLGMLWSIGKDSTVLLWLARKAFLGHVPFPLVHVDTGFKIPEMIRFRDRLAQEWGLKLYVGRNEAALKEGMGPEQGRVRCCTVLKTDALKAVMAERDLNALILGIRRDEEGTRAKERVFSPRDAKFEWDFKDQPPELWDQFMTSFEKGTHVRVHPLLHWTEIDVWEYIDRESIPIVPLYFADEEGQRYRTLGCAPCTGKVPSQARNVPEIIEELRTTRLAERSTRAQDAEGAYAMQKLRAMGYM
jgi:sulfate adenylyltransferase subunit 2